MKVEIIIIRFNNSEVELPCVESVLRHTSQFGLTVTIYDNYPDNRNIAVIWNELINKSDAEYICLLNSDTIVSPGWLDKLLEVFKLQQDAGVVGPTTNNSHNHQSSILPVAQYEVMDFSQFILPNGLPEVLSGFCIVFPKKIWQEVSGIPEDFGFYGQEVEFIDNICKKGYKQYWRKDVFIHHEGSATVKKLAKLGLFNEEQERALAVGRRKR